MSYREFSDFLKANRPYMNLSQRAAVKHAGRSMYHHITGLGDKVDKATGGIILEGDRRLRTRLEREIRQRVTLGIE